MATQRTHLKQSWAEIQLAYMKAYNQSPHRAEPLYSIADHWSKEKQYHMCYLFARSATQLAYPKQDVLWVQEMVYQWQAPLLLSKCAFETGQFREAAQALIKATQGGAPDNETLKNLMALLKQKFSEQEWQSFLGDKDIVAHKEKMSATSLQNARGEDHMNNNRSWLNMILMLFLAVVAGMLGAVVLLFICWWTRRWWKTSDDSAMKLV